MAAKKDLVIVESPAKAKTIGKYLGDGYRVTASMGHLRDLPKSTMGVDLENGFTPDYRPVKGREDTIAELRKATKASGKVYLATDPDREGEAISWHLKELLNLKDESTYRVTFNEITKQVVQESIKRPRAIDQDLVDAQQARRILDRIVGYKLSPLLWRKIRKGLSAGRVQSVATRMVTDREEDIRAFQPEEYWHLDVVLGAEDGAFTARYYGTNGKKHELCSEEETNQVVADIQNAPFIVKSVKRTDRPKSPPPPFTTSTLQQEASRKIGMTPRRTMSIAQQLYEGVDVEGEGTVGLITYMRTDSLRLSEEALASAKEFITGRYGPKFHPGEPRHFKTKGSAQDAHEAIRPANVFFTPERLKSSLTGDQYRLYRLIWSRFIACQMTPAVYDAVAVETESAGHSFRTNRSVLKFAGYTAVYEEGKDEEKEESRAPLPEIQEGSQLQLRDVSREQKFTQPPSRYTEATLIKHMEESGVGRPSTYAPTVSTILDREYVVKEGKFLRPTPLGEVVTKLMKDRFADIVDLGFTARMEETLDSVEKGQRDWKSVLGEFYGPFDTALSDAERAMEGERIRVPDEVTSEICPQCGKNLVVRSGKFGRFLACPGFPDCSFTKPIVIEMPGKCPKCGSRILKRTSRNGHTYYACERLPECGFMTWDVPVADLCPECGKSMFKTAGRGARRPFCVNAVCPAFLPEEKRGYRRKPAAEQAQAAPANEHVPAEVLPAEPAVAEEAPAKKTTKKTTTKKPAAKKPAAKKTATKKTTAKKPAAKKTKGGEA